MGRTADRHQDGRRFVQRMHAVAGGREVRKRAVARALGAVPAEEAASLLQAVLRLERSGDEAAACVLASTMAALEDPALGRALQTALGLLPPERLPEPVRGLLASGPAWRTYDEDAAARADARNFPETLGLLKTKARTARDPDALSRLALASEPSVVQALLHNPRLTEPAVVRLAARRPARPGPLLEVWRSRWGTHHPVRRALALNPYLPPEVGVKVLPLLLRTDWQEVARDGGLHPNLRAEARALLGAEVEAGSVEAREPLELDAEG